MEIDVPLFGVVARRVEEEKVSGLKLFHTTNGGVTEVMPRLAEVEADVQDLIEAHMETMLGVRFLASEYVIDCVDGRRIDSLGIDENNAPVIVEFKCGTDAGAIHQGLFSGTEMPCFVAFPRSHVIPMTHHVECVVVLEKAAKGA